MFHVYVLKSQKCGRRYVGFCENLETRIRRHDLGRSNGTHHGVAWILVHSENCSNRAEPTKKEKYYKSGRGRDELDQLQCGFESRQPPKF
jgi:putative endonuclease